MLGNTEQCDLLSWGASQQGEGGGWLQPSSSIGSGWLIMLFDCFTFMWVFSDNKILVRHTWKYYSLFWISTTFYGLTSRCGFVGIRIVRLVSLLSSSRAQRYRRRKYHNIIVILITSARCRECQRPRMGWTLCLQYLSGKNVQLYNIDLAFTSFYYLLQEVSPQAGLRP